MSFLNEYCKVMTPLVSALNILQPETNTHMRWLLPVIFLLKTKLQRREASCQMCLPLIRAIQNGLQKLFGEMMEEPQLLAAVILLPKFKTSQTDKADVITAGLAYLNNHLDTITLDETEHLRQHSSDEENFLLITDNQTVRRYRGAGWVSCQSIGQNGFTSFVSVHKEVAACERLFSCAGLLFTAKRARIDSINLEDQLLLKLNGKFREK